MNIRPLSCLTSVCLLVFSLIPTTSGAEEPGTLDRLWSWAETTEEIVQTVAVDGLDDAVESLDGHLRQTELDKLLQIRESLADTKTATDARYTTAMGERSRLNKKLYTEFQAQKKANPGRGFWQNARNAEANVSHFQNSSLHHADSKTLATMRVESAVNVTRLERVAKNIEKAEEGIAAGKSISPFKAQGWLQKFGKFLDAVDFVESLSLVAADAVGVYEGDTSVQGVFERAGEEITKRVVVAKAVAAAGTLGSATGVLAPVAVPALVMVASQAASSKFEDTVGHAMELRRQQLANERARQLYEMDPQELARRRAENRAWSQRQNAEAALARAKTKEVNLDELRADVQACYAKWDEEKKREQQAAAPPAAPDIGAALQSVETMITNTLQSSSLMSMLSPDLQAALANVQSHLQAPAAPFVPPPAPPVLETLQQQATTEVSSVVVQQIQTTTKSEAANQGAREPQSATAGKPSKTPPKKTNNKDMDAIMRKIQRDCIEHASRSIGRIPLKK